MTSPLATVAQICNLLYRGFPIRRPRVFPINYSISTAGRMQFGDTADYKSALYAAVQRGGVRPSSGAAMLQLSTHPFFSSAPERRKLLRPGRAHSAGFTLIELMVVIGIIGILTAMMIPEMKGTFQDALLRSTSRELINVFDLAYSRAISLNQIRRVSLDQNTGRYLVEKQIIENGEEIFVPADDVPGAKGELDSRIAVEFHSPDEIPADSSSASPENVSDETAIDFYPDGTADPGGILLRDHEGFRLMLEINPVTARVHVVEMEREAPR